jgi:hypothetical protein
MLWCGNSARHPEDRVVRTGRHTFKEEARESVELARKVAPDKDNLCGCVTRIIVAKNTACLRALMKLDYLGGLRLAQHLLMNNAPGN